MKTKSLIRKPLLIAAFVCVGSTCFAPPPPAVVRPGPRPRVIVPPPRRPVVVTPAPVAGTAVNVQRALKARGYYGGAIDGLIGPRSRAAIRAYQADHGIPVTGVIDAPLLRSLAVD